MVFSFSRFKRPTTLLVYIIGSFFLLSLFSPQYAYAASQPELTLLAHASEFDFNDCTGATIVGKNFTHSGTVLLTGLGDILVTPSQVSVGSEGNFEAKINSCYTGFASDGDGRLIGVRDFSVTATDTATSAVATTTPVTIVDPTPRVHVLSDNVPLFKGCATVGIIGDHFIASGLVNNVVSILAFRVDNAYTSGDNQLPHQPYQINALGGGNIAISAQFCGLAQGDVFVLLLQDRGSYNISDRIFIQTH